jgi:preprotein translocase subunit Sec61beta
MAKDKVYMPQSTAGLMRYFEEADEAIKFKPEHVAIATIAIIIAEVALKFLIV